AVNDPGDGFGLLANGENLGYADEVLTLADLAMRTDDASAGVILHGGHVKISIQNVEIWAAQLSDLLVAILQSPFDESLRDTVTQAVEVADHILNGVDLDNDGKVSPILGEGGTLTAYQHAYYMAEMVILFGEDRIMPPIPTSTPAPNLNPASTLPVTASPTQSIFTLPVPTQTVVTQIPTLPLPTLSPPTLPVPTLPRATAPVPTSPLPTLPIPPLHNFSSMARPTLESGLSKLLARVLIASLFGVHFVAAAYRGNSS
ncbi:MAG: hypothetical protein AB1750_17975, partial [Chloroflexota bacterium]